MSETPGRGRIRRGLRLGLIGAVALLPASPGLAQAEAGRALVDRVETYLNGIDTLQARFDQIANNGREASGELYIDKPGRMRLDYDPPSRILLVAPGDWRLIFYDGSIQQVNVIPISRTPLGVLLEEEIRLGDSIEVMATDHSGGQAAIRLSRKDAPDQGHVTLYFDEQPFELTSWTVVDAQGETTHILLEDVETGVDLDSELFRWRDPKIWGYPDE